MNITKRLCVLLAAVLICFTICPVFAQARASEYLNSYSVNAVEGDSRGQIDITFTVRATNTFSKLGALKIVIYKSNGDYVTTIWGSTSNGLLSPSSGRYYGYSYPYKGTAGVSYYAVVTICAGTATNYDTREVTSPVVRAPY